MVRSMQVSGEMKNGSSQPQDQPQSFDQLKKEIDLLFSQQQEALRRATYLGMTPEEAKEVDERRVRIKALVEQMFGLTRPSRRMRKPR